MGDLQNLDLGQRKPTRHIRFGIGREEDVDTSERREQHDSVAMRMLPDEPAAVGPEDTDPEAPDVELLPDARSDDRDAARACSRLRGSLVRPISRLQRVDKLADGEISEDIRCAADVVAMRVRQDDRGERTDAERTKLAVDTGLRGPGIDEHRSLRHLEQLRVALTHVQEGDP